MLPIPEEILTQIIESKLKSIREDLDIIDRIFPNATIQNRNRLKEYLRKNKLIVLRGYPRDVAQIPCYVIMLGGEREKETAIGSFLEDTDIVETALEQEYQKVIKFRGDKIAFQVAKKPITNDIEALKSLTINFNGVEYDYTNLKVVDYNKGIIQINDDLQDIIHVDDEVFIQYVRNVSGTEWEGTRMTAQFRIETWTNNGDLTVMLYHLLKFIILSSRDELNGWQFLEQALGGTDFEPLAEYLPEFIYRRILTLEFSYEMYYDVKFPFISEVIDLSLDDDDSYGW